MVAKFYFKNKGFTLIELLVVIAVIGFLSSVVLVSLQGVKEKAGIAKALKFSQTVQHALGAYAVGWWSFETIEGGKVIDGSSYGNNGTVNGATIAPGMEELGNALSFDGVNDYVDAGNAASVRIDGAITIEAWVKTTETSLDDRLIVGRFSGGAINRNYVLINSYGKIKFEHGNGTNNESLITTSVVFGEDIWKHIVFTGISRGAAKIYINGSAIKSGTLLYDIVSTDTANLTISHSTYRFSGLIDEVRIYTQALSAAEIQKHYVEGLERYQYAKR